MLHARALGFALCLAASSIVVASTSRAQSVLQLYAGSQQYSHFGDGGIYVGDTDGDGVGDFLVGAPLEEVPVAQEGRAYLFSGATQELIRTHAGEMPYDYLGFNLAAPGDVNGDGFADYAIGVYNGDVNGYAEMYSGVDGELLWRLTHGPLEGYLGFAFAVLDDLNGDGVQELAVGAPRFDDRVRVVSGSDGTTLYQVFGGGTTTDEFGWSLASVPDVDGDGKNDLWVGAPQFGNRSQFSGAGFVRLLSGATGVQLLQIDGHQVGMDFGAQIANVGDATGDGKADLLVVERGLATAFLYDGANGNELRSYALQVASQDPRTSITGVGDVNGDGFDDHAIGTPLDCVGTLCSGKVRIYSGIDGALLQTLAGHESEAPHDRFGQFIRGIEDIDQDGRGELLVGSAWGGSSLGGELRVISLAPCAAPTNYCTTSPNSAGAGATIGSLGGTSVDLDDFHLTADGGPADKIGLFFYGAGTASVPLGDGTLCISGPLFRVQPAQFLDGVGSAVQKLHLWGPEAAIGPGELLAGSTWYFQFWHRDPANGGAGVNATDGLAVTFCP
jgi:hypothetical protein